MYQRALDHINVSKECSADLLLCNVVSEYEIGKKLLDDENVDSAGVRGGKIFILFKSIFFDTFFYAIEYQKRHTNEAEVA